MAVHGRAEFRQAFAGIAAAAVAGFTIARRKTMPRFFPRMKTIVSSLEILECRIAPASVFHYTDVDGDKVTLTASVGDLSAAGIVNVVGGVLRLLDLHAGGFDLANLTFSVAKVPGGDGLANVG